MAARDPRRSGLYSFENRPQELAPEMVAQFRRDQVAWTWFSQQAPWYRRVAAFWVMSAKKDETRQRRLAKLVATSAEGRKILA